MSSGRKGRPMVRAHARAQGVALSHQPCLASNGKMGCGCRTRRGERPQHPQDTETKPWESTGCCGRALWAPREVQARKPPGAQRNIRIQAARARPDLVHAGTPVAQDDNLGDFSKLLEDCRNGPQERQIATQDGTSSGSWLGLMHRYPYASLRQVRSHLRAHHPPPESSGSDPRRA
jgi:hypothetical protein